MARFLDNIGLAYFWEKIKAWIPFLSRKTQSIPFGQVDSTSTSTVFTATVDGITELRDGVCCYIRNGVVTSATGCTLNINGLGAKPMYYTTSSTGRVTSHFSINYTWLFVYNSTRVAGGCWDSYWGYNSEYNLSQNYIYIGRIDVGDYPTSAYSLGAFDVNGKWTPFVTTATTSTGKSLVQSVFPIGAKIYRDSASRSNNTSYNDVYLYTTLSNSDLRYSSVNHNVAIFPNYNFNRVFMPVIVNTQDNTFTLTTQTTSGYNNNFTNERNLNPNNFYIEIGFNSGSTTSYYFTLICENNLYYYDGKNLIDYYLYKTQLVNADLSNKADKVVGAISGNFAGLDATGNLTDSGCKPSDFLTQHQHLPEYTIEKLTQAENSYSASYVLKKDNVQVGATINIPKDMVVSSGEVKTVTTANVPYQGAQVGDKYIDLTIANTSQNHIYIPVKDLVDVYVAGNGIRISDNNYISVVVDSNNANGLGVGGSGLALYHVTPSVNGSGGSDGAMLATDKEKLDGIEAGAEENVIETVKVSGTALQVTDKAVNIVTETAYDPTTNKIATMSDVTGATPNVGHLKTDNTTAQTPSASESFTGDISLHKIAKTGSYNDLNDQPTIPSAGDFVTSLGTSGNNVTWTKNGTTNNLTVPYATKALQDGNGKTISSTYLPLSGGNMDISATIRFNTYGTRYLTVSGNNIVHDLLLATGGYAGSFYSIKTTGSDGEQHFFTGIGFYGSYGSGTGLHYLYIAGENDSYTNPAVKITPEGFVTFKNAVTAESFVKKGGTSSQFLKADGSVDSNTYATTSQLPSLPLSIANGGTGQTTGVNAANTLIGALPQWTSDPSDDVYLIRRDTGGSLSFGQVKFSTVWNYIKSKIASVLGIGGSNGVPTAPTAAAGTNTTQIATTAFVGSATSGLAIDDEVVHKAGAETITGEKTFEANVNLTEGATLNMVYDSQTPDGVYLQAAELNGLKTVSFSGISDDGMVQIKNVYVPTNDTDAANKYYVDEEILDIDEYRVYLACRFGPYGVHQKSLCAFCLTNGGREMMMTSFTKKSGTAAKEVITDLVFPIGCKIYYNDGTYDSLPNTSAMVNRYYTSFNGVDVRYSAITGTSISLGNYPSETQSTVYLHVIVEDGYWKPYYKEGATNEIIVDSFHMQSGNFYIYLGKTVRNTGYMIQLEDNNPLYYYDGTKLVDWASFQSDTNYSSIQQDLSNYYTKSETYSQDEVDALLNGMSNFEYVVIQPPATLPTASSSTMGKMYIYNGHRWITVENNGSYSWVDLGSYDVDLSDYVTNEDFEEALEDRPIFQLVTETQMQNMLDNETWVEGVIYYTVED